MSGQKEPIAAVNEDCAPEETITGDNFEPLPPGSKAMLSVGGLEHT